MAHRHRYHEISHFVKHAEGMVFLDPTIEMQITMKQAHLRFREKFKQCCVHNFIILSKFGLE